MMDLSRSFTRFRLVCGRALHLAIGSTVILALAICAARLVQSSRSKCTTIECQIYWGLTDACEGHGTCVVGLADYVPLLWDRAFACERFELGRKEIEQALGMSYNQPLGSRVLVFLKGNEVVLGEVEPFNVEHPTHGEVIIDHPPSSAACTSFTAADHFRVTFENEEDSRYAVLRRIEPPGTR